MSQVSQSVRRLCSQRDKGRCVRCPGGKMATQLHHRRPRGMGSTKRPESNLPANLVSLCNECHAEVESDRLMAYTQGWLVAQDADPEKVILHTPRGSLLLSNDGGFLLVKASSQL